LAHRANLAVVGNEELLVRLFANLLSNSVRHTANESPITVTIDREDDYAVVIVEDMGEGIAVEHLAHVTERFYRSDSARSGHQGSGLGLAICKSIVTAHGGSIEIASRQEIGTSVTIRIPLAR